MELYILNSISRFRVVINSLFPQGLQASSMAGPRVSSDLHHIQSFTRSQAASTGLPAEALFGVRLLNCLM